jgi:membrane associated rhomboid family serine protease
MQRATPLVLNLIIINTLVFFAQMIISRGIEPNVITDLFALHHYKSDYFKPHQLVTYLFMHGGFFHLLFNMFSLWMFGSSVEGALGGKKFLILYFVCGIGAGLTQLASYTHDFWQIYHNLLSADLRDQYQMVLRRVATVGASGSIMGVLVAFGYMFANTELFIIPIPFPIKAKWAVGGMIAYDVFGGVAKVQDDNIAHFAHIGGALIGFLLVLYWNKNNHKTFYRR